MKTHPPEFRLPFGYSTASAVVIASMIGTGVFTTLGLEAEELKSGFSLMLLWFVGGVMALAGALSYGELAAAMPRSGGEYHFLGKIYHPVLGIVAGWISVTIGFAAPSALAAMAFSQYASVFTDVPLTSLAVLVLVTVSAFHACTVTIGRHFHIATTAAKIFFILGFCICGLLVDPASDANAGPSLTGWREVLSPSFAFSLIYVSYAYSGWNAATYIISEVEEPRRVVPRALFHGTLIVTMLYLLLNFVFLRTIPVHELAGTLDVGALSARYIFGDYGRSLASAMICVLLLSTISAMVMTGTRVLQVAGEDLPGLRPLAVRTRGGTPLRAILLQLSLAIAFVVTDSFEGVLSFAGFTLILITILTVVGVFVLRHTAPDMPRPYRVWGYPLTPAAFVIVNTLILAFVLQARPVAAIGSLLMIMTAAVWAWLHIRRRA